MKAERRRKRERAKKKRDKDFLTNDIKKFLRVWSDGTSGRTLALHVLT